jgi:transcriptional regulator with XRE-family HTH domain
VRYAEVTSSLGRYITARYIGQVTVTVPLPAAAWHRAEVRDASAARDIPALLRYAQAHTGASQARLAEAFEMAQSRVNEIINRRRAVTTLEVYERIAAGLDMPDDVRMLLGLAPVRPHAAFPLAALAEVTEIYPSQAAAAHEIRLAAMVAERLDVVAVRGLGILGMNDGLLRGPLTVERDRPLLLRVFVLDPRCPAAEARARQIGETPATFAAACSLSLEKLRDLKAIPSVRLQVHQYRQRPVWRIIHAGASMFVGTFDELREGHHSPVYRLPRRVDGTLYRAFAAVVDQLLEDGEQII